MKSNLLIIIVIATLALALIVFLVLKNQKDKKQLEQQLNRDYPHKDDKEGDVEIEDMGKV